MPQSVLVDALVSNYSWTGTEVTYAFVDAGEDTFTGSYSGGSALTSGWTADQKALVHGIYDDVSNITGLQFSETGDTATSNIDFQSVESVPGGWAGYANYPSNYFGSTIVVGERFLTTGDTRTSNVLVHEIGHALGLEHTHDGSEEFPNVDHYSDPGDHSLNNGLFSVMSYNRPFDPEHPNLGIYASQVNFMAFDIAALQEIYGVNSHATGNDNYEQTTRLMSIWDSGGRDKINFGAALEDTVIDLRAATLQNEPGGGGYLSFVYGQSSNTSTTGGYTIANGVKIEDATGGAGDDAITGNAFANVLTGRDGDDIVLGGNRGDTISGGKGKDTLEGENGDDSIEGNGGRDKLMGGNGTDHLKGGDGRDTLKGEQGNDKLWGDDGADRFVFEIGDDKDVIKDFQNNIDEIRIIGLGNKAAVMAKATKVGDDVVIKFGDGDTLTILDTSIGAVRDDILT